jgi:natural product precursor
MKKEKVSEKLTLKKETVAKLDSVEMKALRGGSWIPASQVDQCSYRPCTI